MYYKQLDGLRAFAVIIVIIHHWIPKNHPFASIAHWGTNVVVLFFVLSGFLITSILLKQKEKDNFKIASGLKTFYIRRSLRIFPIYYFVILILTIFLYDTIKDKIIWLSLYQYNNHIFLFNWQSPVFIQHLWTISIEEQFYLIWPFVLFFLNNKNAHRFIVFLTFVSIICTVLLYKISPGTPYSQFTLSSFSGLAIGSLLAFRKHKGKVIKQRKLTFFLTLILTIYFAGSFLHFPGRSFINVFIPFTTILSVILVDKTLEGFNGPIKRMLENRFIVFIGKISYGLYLYHMFIPYITRYLKWEFEINYLQQILNTTILLCISIISWYLIEKPINNIKTRFKY